MHLVLYKYALINFYLYLIWEEIDVWANYKDRKDRIFNHIFWISIPESEILGCNTYFNRDKTGAMWMLKNNGS